jgi:hypothetical protein
LLVPSATCYAGQGYCFALACFANEASIEYLNLYLDEYLPQPDKHYDQTWAMPSLIWIDKIKNTDYSKKYLESKGLWERFVFGKTEHDNWNLTLLNQRFERVMMFRNNWFSEM